MAEQQTEREYLEQRQRSCEESARNATDLGVAKIHRQFADHYAARIKGDVKPLRPRA